MTSPLLNDGPPSDLPPSPRLSSPSLFFNHPENATPVPEPETDPDTGAVIPSLHLVDEPAGSASDSGWSDDELSALHDGQSSSPASPTGSPLSRAAARKTARAAVLTAGGMANRFLVQTAGQAQVGLYLADEDDAQAIGDPLGNIAHRHSGAIGQAANPDVADGLQALMGLVSYVSKQIVSTAQAKRIDAGPQATQAFVQQEAS